LLCKNAERKEKGEEEMSIEKIKVTKNRTDWLKASLSNKYGDVFRYRFRLMSKFGGTTTGIFDLFYNSLWNKGILKDKYKTLQKKYVKMGLYD
jgi:hypothetical protein